MPFKAVPERVNCTVSAVALFPLARERRKRPVFAPGSEQLESESETLTVDSSSRSVTLYALVE